MTREEAIEALEEVFEESGLTEDKSLDDLAWDSMAKLSVIAMAKSRADKRISGPEVRAFKTVGDIVAALI